MKKYILFILLTTVISLSTSLSGSTLQFSTKLVVVGNNVGFKEASFDEIIAIFKGKKSQWSNGEAVTIVLPSSKADFAGIVANEVYKTSVNGMQKYWLSWVFQGRGNSPVFVTSEKEMVETIRATPGSIGLLPSSYNDIPSSLIIKVKN
jgi:ABC-type phosphate transport system substrate-binding protein